MRKYLVTMLCTFSLAAAAQGPVSWEFTSIPAGSSYIFQVKGHPAKGWHVYADRDTTEELEPAALTGDNEQVQFGKPIYTSAAAFIKDPLFHNKRFRVYQNEFTFTQSIQFTGIAPALLRVTINGFSSNGKEFLPAEKIIEVSLKGGTASTQNIKLNTVDLSKPASTCGAAPQPAGKVLLAIFMPGIAGGLLALLTPCVFPMIPVTVSFFTNMRADTSKSSGSGTFDSSRRTGITSHRNMGCLTPISKKHDSRTFSAS